MVVKTKHGEEENTLENIKIVPATSVNFDRKNDLVKTLKKIDKSVDAAIEYLESVVKDATAETKTRVQAAQFIVDKKIAISESVSKDNLNRAIATSRLILAERATQAKQIKNVTPEDDDEEDTVPLYCPDILLDHSNISKM